MVEDSCLGPFTSVAEDCQVYHVAGTHELTNVELTDRLLRHSPACSLATTETMTAQVEKHRILVPTRAFLAEFAGAGRALEFAIGTGRVGVRLRKRGVPVVGIELARRPVPSSSLYDTPASS